MKKVHFEIFLSSTFIMYSESCLSGHLIISIHQRNFELVRKLNVTDRRGGGGGGERRFNISCPGPFGTAGDKNVMDRETEGQCFNISRPRPSARWEIKIHHR